MKKFEKDLRDGKFAHAHMTNWLAEESHKLVSIMNPSEIKFLKESYPEIIMLASKYGSKNELRSQFDNDPIVID